MSKNIDYNYSVHIAELTSTLFCNEGYCVNSNDKLVDALLYLKGMDIKRGYEFKVFTHGEGYRTPQGEVVTGGILYTGYERKDYDPSVGERLLNTKEGVEDLVKALKLK